MTELEQNLRSIKNEKDTKILPENIKEGVQIFDVIGTHRGGVDATPIYSDTRNNEYETNLSFSTYVITSHIGNYFTAVSNQYASLYKYNNGNIELVKQVYNFNSYGKLLCLIDVRNDIPFYIKQCNTSNYEIFNLICCKIEGGVETELFTFRHNYSSPTSIYIGVYNSYNYTCYDTCKVFFPHNGYKCTIDIDNSTATWGRSLLPYSYMYNKNIIFSNSSSTHGFQLIDSGNKCTLSSNQLISYVDTLERVVCVNNNLYKYNLDYTLGNIVKENFIPNYINDYSTKMFNVAGDTFIYNNKILRLDRDTYTLYETGDTYLSVGGGHYNGLFTKDPNNLIHILEYKTTFSHIVGYVYNGVNFYEPKFASIRPSTTLSGVQVYDIDGTTYMGSMPNNGQLNYTPTTSQQTIPAGYTSGGTISAVSVNEQEYQEDLDLANDILGID